MRGFNGLMPVVLGILIIASPASAATITFSNFGAIAIIDTTVGSAESAIPYPSNIAVSGFDGLTTKVTATLFAMSHTFPGDIDILLVDPTGIHTLLMSDTGVDNDVVGVTLTFDDAASSFVPSTLPDDAQIISGTYKPTNIGSADLFPAPAPVGPYAASALSVFNGANPNGTWSLYVVDDVVADIGSIAGGWSLTISDEPSAAVPEPASMLLLGTGLVVAGVRCWRKSRLNG